MRRSLPDCSATTGCTVMCIVAKLGSFAYHIFFFLSAKFRDCIFFPSRGIIFNVPECILAVVMSTTEDSFYQLRPTEKNLKEVYKRSQLTFCPKNLLRIEGIPN